MKCYRATGDLFTDCGQKASTVDSSMTHSQHFVLTASERREQSVLMSRCVGDKLTSD